MCITLSYPRHSRHSSIVGIEHLTTVKFDQISPAVGWNGSSVSNKKLILCKGDIEHLWNSYKLVSNYEKLNYHIPSSSLPQFDVREHNMVMVIK